MDRKINLYKALFIGNDSGLFEKINHFTKYTGVSKSTQEYLFFGPINSKRFDALDFSELFNDQINYVNHWIEFLHHVTDNQSWENHQAKIISRFNRLKSINKEDIEEILEMEQSNSVNDKQIARELLNRIYVFNKVVNHFEQNTMKTNYSDKDWKVWKILTHYIHEEYDQIIPLLQQDKKHTINKVNKIVETTLKSSHLKDLLIEEQKYLVDIAPAIEKMTVTSSLFLSLPIKNPFKKNKNKI